MNIWWQPATKASSKSGVHSTWRHSTRSPSAIVESVRCRWHTIKSKFPPAIICSNPFQIRFVIPQIFASWLGYGIHHRVPHRLQPLASRVSAALLNICQQQSLIKTPFHPRCSKIRKRSGEGKKKSCVLWIGKNNLRESAAKSTFVGRDSVRSENTSLK